MLLANGGSWNDRAIAAQVSTNNAASSVANAAADILTRSNMRFNSRALLQDTADVNAAAQRVTEKLVGMASATAARVSAAGRALLQGADLANNYVDSMSTNTAVINAGSAQVSRAAADIMANVNSRFASLTAR